MDRKEKLEMLRKFDEPRLTKEILIPLFETMGFTNVLYHHGVLEHGKDVIYCQKTKFLKYRHTGVQVKSADINTQVADKLFCQVARGLGKPFLDLADNNKEKPIDELIVLCSGEIKENARENISSTLNAVHVDKPVSFITGEDLVSLLDEYMPSAFWKEYDYFDKYFDAMRADFETIRDVSAIGQREAVRLENIYVSLKLSEQVKEPEIPPEAERKIFEAKLSERQKEHIERRTERTKVLDAEKAVADYDRLVIVGAPGSGKTTLLKYLALRACRENLQKQERICVPIPVVLRELAESDKDLRSYIDSVFEKYDFPKAKKSVEKDLKAGRCTLFLDGFDELATKENQRKVAGQIEGFVGKYRNAQLVVTSRVAGYHDELKGFTKVELMEFDDKQIEKFIANWFGEREPDRAHSMFGAIKQNERIKALARNPLMIAIIAIIYEEDRKLPQRRADLYKRCVEVLLSKWDVQKRIKNKYPVAEKEFILRKLAFYGHTNNKRIMTEKEVMDEMLRHFPQIGLDAQEAKPVLDEIWQRSYLLRQISMDSYDFLHLSFQEYFTALELKESEDGLSTIIENIDKPWWEEPTLLYAGISRNASALIKAIEEGVPEDMFCSNLLLFGRCVADADFTEVSLKDRIVDELWSLYQTAEFRVLRDKLVEVFRLIKPGNIIESLIEDLARAKQSDVRLRAAEALGRIGSEKAIEPLAQALATDEESDVRYVAAEALGLIGSDSAIRPLMETLATGEEGGLRWSVTHALGRIGSEKAIEPLSEALATSKDTAVRDSAAYALGLIGSEKATGPLREALATDGNSRVRARAAGALGRIGGEKAASPLTEALATDKDSPVRGSAADALGRIGSEKAIEPLSEALVTDSRHFVRGRAAEALGRMGSEAPIQALTKALTSDKRTYVRGRAGQALGRIGSKKTIEPLTQALATSKDSYVRGRAAEALGRIRSQKAIEPLTKALATDKQSSVRWRAAGALGRIGGENVIEPLIDALATGKDSSVRWKAADALGLIGTEKATRPLIRAMATDEDSFVRGHAASALGRIASEKAIESLKKALEDEGEYYRDKVRDAAFAALEKIRNRIVITESSRGLWVK